jgi:VWFA-related protein
VDRAGLPRGRQIVLFIQRDLEPTRFEGLAGLLRRARAFVAGLGPDDRVAVVSFESTLSIWTDFTADRRAVDALLERRILMGAPPASVPSSALPSLALSFDRQAARRAATMEQALLVMARALGHVPGAKSLVVFGHGFGRLLGGVTNTMGFDREYGEARQQLLASRTAVYCLDTTRAASHSLEAGLRQVAADTGGFYLRTDEFADAALRRLGDALTGRYELSIETPVLPAGEHRLTVTLIGRKGIVLARRSYVG